MYPQRTIIPIQEPDRHALTVEATSVPTAKFEPSFGTILPVVDLHGQQKALWKTDQSTLASGGNEHAWIFSIAIN